jgi:hypothetical protein
MESSRASQGTVVLHDSRFGRGQAGEFHEFPLKHEFNELQHGELHRASLELPD